MERELLMTGIGGQGVQLGALVLARAAVAEGRQAMVFGSYGGMMRGGNTDATVVLADGPLDSPPTVASAWSAIAVHSEYWAGTARRLRPDAVVVVNSSVVTGPLGVDSDRVVEVPASTLAGGPQGVTLVLVGAYAAVTAMVGPEALAEALVASLPPYRASAAPAAGAALEAGARAVEPGLYPAWARAGVAS
jgi:Pyruvate/2-oxoacid:ferredoxin oxidoreductase gamma subunit